MAERSALISVLMPVFDAERTLAEALESILVQSFDAFELLALDDGSADGSAEILADFAGRDPRVCVSSGAHQGLVGQLNCGLKAARGEFVARMDADDLCHPERFERQIAYLRAHADCVGVGTGCIEVDPELRPIRSLGVPTEHDAIVARLIAGDGGALIHASALYRTEALRQIGGYRAEFEGGEDVDLHLRLAEVGRLANLAEPLFTYRKNFAGVTLSRRAEVRASQDAAIAEALERRGLGADSAPERPPLEASPGQDRVWAIWAHRALVAEQPQTARHWAWQAFRAAPRQHWKLLLRVVLGVEPFFWDRLLGR